MSTVCSRTSSSLVNARLQHYEQLEVGVTGDEKSDVVFDGDGIGCDDGLGIDE